MAEPQAPVAPSSSYAPSSADAPGAAAYASRCASCHGPSGEGGVRVRMLGSAPYAYMTTMPLSASHAAGDPARFEKVVLEGLPGWAMPGNGDLSREEIRALYDFTVSLRARQSTASAPAGPNRS
jgi:mono/diheme cytochrome c family protein